MDQQIKVVVTGASGFIGSHLVRRLHKESRVDVHVIRRASTELSPLQGIPIKLETADVNDTPSLIQAFQGAEVVFHLAGVVGYTRKMRAVMEKVNVEGTRAIVEACKVTGVRRLVHMSSVTAVGASSNGEVLNETSTYNLQHLDLGYFETKRKAEEIVLNSVARGEVDAVVLNPSTVYGSGDARKGSRKTQIKVARGEFPFYPPGGVSVADVACVCDALVNAWKKGRKGERYILAGQNVTIHELFEMIAHFAGKAPPKYALPRQAIFALGRLGEVLEKVGLKGALNMETAWTSVLFHWYDSTKAVRELDYRIPPARDPISESVKWMRDQGVL